MKKMIGWVALFVIALAVAAGAQAPCAPAAVAAPAAAEAPPRGRGECILLVDDEAFARQVARQILEQNGYRNDMGLVRRHHEIYLGDPRRTAPLRSPESRPRGAVRRAHAATGICITPSTITPGSRIPRSSMTSAKRPRQGSWHVRSRTSKASV